jgi:replicative DNA helicase
VVVGGRPGMGKTSFLMTLACNLMQKKINCIYFTAESSEEELKKKILCQLAEVEISEIKDFDNPKCEDMIKYQRIVGAANMMNKNNLTVCQCNDFRQMCDFFKNQCQTMQGVDVFFVDYLQLLNFSSDKDNVAEIMVNLKKICMEYRICIVISSQLSRDVEKRMGHFPIITDFRDSGYIEETADQVITLHRREYYDPMDKPGMCLLRLHKNRLGEVGFVDLIFRKEIMQFCNYTPFVFDETKSEETVFSQFSN